MPRRGDDIFADDGYLGVVDDLITDVSGSLAFVVVRVGPIWRRRRPVLAAALVGDVDRHSGLTRVLGSKAALMRLPEAVPIVM